jgi:hypothetical protein
MGLDSLERGISYFASAIAVISAALFIPHLTKNTWITDTAKYVKGKACPTGYTHAATLCEKHQLTHPSYWMPQFLLILVVGLFILLFAWRRKRVGVIVASLLLGLAGGTAGIVFLFLAAWLVIRAFRLQKYGDATFTGSSRRARTMGQEKREGRDSTPRRTRASKDSKTTAKTAVAPAPSKRYTPKKPSRRK